MNGYEKILLGLLVGFILAYLIGPKKVMIVTTDLSANGTDLVNAG